MMVVMNVANSEEKAATRRCEVPLMCPKFQQHSRDTLIQAQTTQTSEHSPTTVHSKSTQC